jgi:glycosyltransferase involved in cell wall biosynthesis
VKRLKVLISAYACRPGEGSEPGVGWNIVRELVKYHDVWVLTRESNRPSIAAELARAPLSGLQFVYCEPPRLVQKLNYKQQLVHLHYYLWQIAAYLGARKLHKEIDFNIVHHVTYVRYSSPSFLSLLPIPFVWGPVGGGEVAPSAFWQDFGFQGKIYEIVRITAHRLGELDPFTRLTARRSVMSRATTEDTALRMRQLGARNVEILSESGLSQDEISRLSQCSMPVDSTVRFISMARLLHWKGLHLGIRAFAQANLPFAEYWILGEGAEKKRLQALVDELGITERVRFWGRLSRDETLTRLGESHVLVHPSLHDSGGWVCLEAMAAGRPVICLDLGGPSVQVTEETGFKVSAHTPEQTLRELAQAMVCLGKNLELRMCMGQAAQKRVRDVFSWSNKIGALAVLYEVLLDEYQSKAV